MAHKFLDWGLPSTVRPKPFHEIKRSPLGGNHGTEKGQSVAKARPHVSYSPGKPPHPSALLALTGIEQNHNPSISKGLGRDSDMYKKVMKGRKDEGKRTGSDGRRLSDNTWADASFHGVHHLGHRDARSGKTDHRGSRAEYGRVGLDSGVPDALLESNRRATSNDVPSHGQQRLSAGRGGQVILSPTPSNNVGRYLGMPESSIRQHVRGQAENHDERSYGLRQHGRIAVRDDDFLASDSKMSGPDREDAYFRYLDGHGGGDEPSSDY
jgi:hypothetical protein